MKKAALLSSLFFMVWTLPVNALVPPPDPNQLLKSADLQQKDATAQGQNVLNAAVQPGNEVTKTQAEAVGKKQFDASELKATQAKESEAAPSAAPEPDPKESASAPIGGIDTVNIEDGGNWLLKRKAVEDTINELEKIKNLYTMILELLQGYLTKRNEIDGEYDVFVAQLQFDVGDADQLITDLIAQLNKERQKEGDLSEQERELLDQVNQKQKDLGVIKEGIKALTELDSKMVEVLTTVDNQIKMANNHQNQAWKNFQEMKQVLSDERAEELYYQTVSLNKSMQEIYAYLKTTLAEYYNEQIKIMRDQMGKVKDSVERLKKVGINLKNEFDKLEEQDLQADKKREQEQIEREVEEKVDEIELARKQKQARSWWNLFVQSFAQMFNMIGSFLSTAWNSIASLWGGGRKAAVQATNDIQIIEGAQGNESPSPIEQEPL